MTQIQHEYTLDLDSSCISRVCVYDNVSQYLINLLDILGVSRRRRSSLSLSHTHTTTQSLPSLVPLADKLSLSPILLVLNQLVLY